jgi:hypothetical protein
MNFVLQDFILDLQRLKRMIDLSSQLRSFPAIDLNPAGIQEDLVKDTVTKLHALARESHSDIPILNGVLLLYLAGRFENFVREIFEDLCDSLASQFTEFAHLPKQMQENLVRFTADVIANPRKYGHADNGVIAFVKILSDNLSGVPLSGVNSKCLSITTENMWPDTISEIFSRIGASKVWERIGQQANVQVLFQIDQPEKATREAKKTLTELMELRNRIAHPSGATTWPSTEQASQYLLYCEEIAIALSEICDMWSNTLGKREGEAQTEPWPGTNKPRYSS